ncbi:MAG: PLxRFG domain-containing protein [Moraxella sp.]|nr:PLxRFG domain-containing protein [Moraxella sp.]
MADNRNMAGDKQATQPAKPAPAKQSNTSGYHLPDNINADWAKSTSKNPVITPRQKQLIQAVQQARQEGLTDDADITNHAARSLQVSSQDLNQQGMGSLSKFELDVMAAINTLDNTDSDKLNKAMDKANKIVAKPSDSLQVDNKVSNQDNSDKTSQPQVAPQAEQADDSQATAEPTAKNETHTKEYLADAKEAQALVDEYKASGINPLQIKHVDKQLSGGYISNAVNIVNNIKAGKKPQIGADNKHRVIDDTGDGITLANKTQYSFAVWAYEKLQGGEQDNKQGNNQSNKASDGAATSTIELTGKEFGENETKNIQLLRQKAIDYLQSLKGDYVTIPALAHVEQDPQVEIRERGIKHIESYSADPRKLQILVKIKDVLATAEYLYSENNVKKDKKLNIEKYHYLKNTVKIDGKSFEFVLVIEKDQNGLLHYDILTNKYAERHLANAQKNGLENIVPEKSQGYAQDLADTIPNQPSEVKPSLPDFSNNKVFTADLVEKARARIKSKMARLNSGIDPELLFDGMVVAGAYVESGIRKFAEYARMMSDDFGDGIKPHLLSFWEAVRHSPDIDTSKMTSAADSKIQYDEMMKAVKAVEHTTKMYDNPAVIQELAEMVMAHKDYDRIYKKSPDERSGARYFAEMVHDVMGSISRENLALYKDFYSNKEHYIDKIKTAVENPALGNPIPQTPKNHTPKAKKNPIQTKNDVRKTAKADPVSAAIVQALNDGAMPRQVGFTDGDHHRFMRLVETVAKATNYQGNALNDNKFINEVVKKYFNILRQQQGLAPYERNTGADMQLTQDWGVDYLNPTDGTDWRADNASLIIKAFDQETKHYLKQVQAALAQQGFVPYNKPNGKADDVISVGHGGEVTLTMQHPQTNQRVYINIGASTLQGSVPTTKSGVAMMYRTYVGGGKFDGGSNTWADTSLTAQELAQLLLEQSATSLEAQAKQNNVNTDGEVKTTGQMKSTSTPVAPAKQSTAETSETLESLTSSKPTIPNPSDNVKTDSNSLDNAQDTGNNGEKNQPKEQPNELSPISPANHRTLEKQPSGQLSTAEQDAQLERVRNEPSQQNEPRSNRADGHDGTKPTNGTKPSDERAARDVSSGDAARDLASDGRTQGVGAVSSEPSIDELNTAFNDELNKLMAGELDDSHVFSLGLPSQVLQDTGMPKLPIELKASKLSEKANTEWHKFDTSHVQNLPQALQNPLAVFSYGDKSKSQNVITEVSVNGKQLLVGIHFNQNRDGLQVNSVRGLFPKDNAEWLNWIAQGKALYIDQQKAQALIDQQRTNLADVDYLDLSLVESIVQGVDKVNGKPQAVSKEVQQVAAITTAIDTATAQSNPSQANFVLDGENISKLGNAETRLNQNIEAIKIVKDIQATGRTASADEKQVLARYSGFGGLSWAFADKHSKPNRAALATKLSELLTKDEWRQASSSSATAYFTPPAVINAMWDMATRLGFNGGVVLEPSVGVGSFIGLMPQGLPTSVIATEIDPITATIAEQLYPQAHIFNQGYEDLKIADGTVDLAIGNPPYGSMSLDTNKPHLRGLPIADQFIVGTLDQLKPSGLSIMVVSSRVMDKGDNTARKLMAQRGWLLTAIRLPSSIFKDTGTNVVTDILVFRKHDQDTLERIEADGVNVYPDWVDSGRHSFDPNEPSAEVELNPFFDNKTVGEIKQTSTQFGDTSYSIDDKNTDTDKALADFVKSVQETKPKRSLEQVEQELEDAQKAMVEHLELHESGKQLSEIYINDKGDVVEVVLMGENLAQRTLTADTIWHKDFEMDSDGRYYREEAILGADGKPLKQTKDDGTPSTLNQKQRVYYTVESTDIKPRERLGEKNLAILKKALEIGQIRNEQFRLESNGASEAEIEANRAKLNKAYQAFVKAYGSLHTHEALIERHVSGHAILALEKNHKKGNKAKGIKESFALADILSKRVIVPTSKPVANTPAEAITLSLAYTGGVDTAMMAEELGMDEQALIDELTNSDKPLIFFDPKQGKYVTKSNYLSGNIRQKIKEAQEHGLVDNEAALMAVLPKDKTLDQVNMSLGMAWIPSGVYTSFVNHLAKTAQAVVSYHEATGFNVSTSNNNADLKSPLALEKLLEMMFNQKPIVVMVTKRRDDGKEYKELDPVLSSEAQEVAGRIKEEFALWLYSQGEVSQSLLKLYNERYNSVVPESYDGSHMLFPGQVDDSIIELRTHQKNAVWRGVTTNAVLYDHAVGSGKTMTGVTRAMERKRLGLSKKPAIIVPNHMVAQFTNEALQLYPAANIKAAGTKDFESKNRKRLLAEIANNDYDLIIIPHSSFDMLEMSTEAQMRYYEEQAYELENFIRRAKDNKMDGKAVQMMNTQLRNFRQKLAKLGERKNKETSLTFEQLGIDDITIDEAHEYKNLFYRTKMQGVKGLNSSAGSKKANQLFMKTHYLHEHGGAIAFMTGTPISNSAAEMHTFMRYLMPRVLKSKGLYHFDAWAVMFAENTQKFEATESGQLKQVTRFAREWKNMPALMADWQTITDSVTNEDIQADFLARKGEEFPIPKVKGGKRVVNAVSPNPETAELMGLVVTGYDELEHGSTITDRKEKAAFRLRLMALAQKLSLDPRVVNPIRYKDSENGKLGKLAGNVVDVYHQWADDKGTQIVFLDRSIPKTKGDDKLIKEYKAAMAELEQAEEDGDIDKMEAASDKLGKYDPDEMEALMVADAGGWNAYDEIKKQLVAQGIPANEIEFIHSANTDKAKTEMFERVNNGTTRIIIGSSPKMGAGTNIQKRLVALHHADVTWKPSDILQREGRIIRQGNELYQKYGHDNFAVELHTYVTEQSFDAKQWDTITAKINTINAIAKYQGEDVLDTGDDVDSQNMAEIAALASGNPKLIERAELDVLVKELENKSKAHARRQGQINQDLAKANRTITEAPAVLNDYNDAGRIAKPLIKQAKDTAKTPSITIDGITFTGFDSRENAHAHVREKAQAAKEASTKETPTKAVFTVNDTKDVSVTNATTEINRALKVVIPTAIHYKGKDYDNISEFVNANSNELVGKAAQADGSVLFSLFGLDVAVDRILNSAVLDIKTPKGRTVHSETLRTTTGLTLINALEKVSMALGKSLDGRIIRAKQSEQVAKDTQEQLAGKANQPFEQAENLAQSRTRLAELNKELAIDDKKLGDDHKQKLYELDEILHQKRYSRTHASHGVSTAEVESTLAKRFGAIIRQLIKQGKLVIVQSVDDLPFKDDLGNDTDMQGAYVDGVSYIVADNIAPHQIIATFLHEHVGHGTFQNTLPKDVYDSLMAEFERLVAAGDPVAIEAKRLASYNARNSDEMMDELLPYLLTLASERQEQAKWYTKMLGRMTMAVKRVLGKLGIPVKITSDDILAMAERIAKTEMATAQNSQQNAQTSNTQLSQSAMKSVQENIKRGRKRMTQAILKKADVHRAMYRNDIGWIDFVWGDTGTLKANGKTKGAMGISHIIEARMRKDGMSHADVVRMLTNDVVGVIARGSVIDEQLREDGTRVLKVKHNGYFTALRKAKGSNAWIITAFELFKDGYGKVDGKTTPTEHQSYSARTGAGALNELGTSIPTSPKTGKPKYQRGRPADKQMAGVSSTVGQLFNEPKAFFDSIGKAFGNMTADYYDKYLRLLGGMQLKKIFAKDIPALGTYIDMVNRMDADANEKAYNADKLVKRWGKLDKAEADSLADIMHTATLQGIDPAEAYVAGDNQIHYRQLKAKWDKLSQEAKDIYTQARDDYKQHQKDTYEAIKERIERSDIDKPKQAELIKEMEQKFFFGQKVYFPLARFGNYVIRVTDTNGDTVAVSRAESKAEADEVRRELLKDYPNDVVSRVMLDKEFNAAQEAVSRGFMSELFKEVDNLNVAADVKANFRDTLGQLYLSSLPDVSFAKSGIHRKGTAGYSTDARRAYAHHMVHGGNYLAKMRYGDQLQNLLDDMQKHVDDSRDDPDFEQIKMQRVVDEMVKRHENVINPKTHPVATFITSMGFIWQLGLSPAAALINLSQTWFVGVPIMGAKWGNGKAALTLVKASQELFNTTKASTNGSFKPWEWEFDVAGKADKVYSKDEQRFATNQWLVAPTHYKASRLSKASNIAWFSSYF